MKRIGIIVWLTLVWMTLWEVASWANLAGGLVAAVAILYLLPPRGEISPVGFRPLRVVKLVLYFLWQLLMASVLVAWQVLNPRSRIRPAVVSVQAQSRVVGIVTSVANMVSLTPGTLTLEVDEETMTLYIHVLHLDSFEKTRASVLRLEELTLDAFPPRPNQRLPGEVLT